MPMAIKITITSKVQGVSYRAFLLTKKSSKNSPKIRTCGDIRIT